MEERRRRRMALLAAVAVSVVTAAVPGAARAAPPGPGAPGASPFAASCRPAPYGVQESAPGTGRTVALTFDGGPGVSTEALMTILEDNGVAATFFDLGEYLGDRPATVVSQGVQGFLLGNHTWSHPHMSMLSASDQADQMDRYNAAQTGLVGYPSCFFRPPFGEYDGTTLAVAQSRGMTVFNWSVDTIDWQEEGSASAASVARIIARAEAGGSQSHPVILMHNGPVGNPATVTALPTIIAFYRDRGYTFVDLGGHVADRPVSGDWDGNGTVTPGVVRGSTWYLRNSNTPGPPDVAFNYGLPSDRVVTGDWDGNGTTTPGVVRGNTWYLRDTNTSGPATIAFAYGRSSDRVITGDWNGNGTVTPGVVRGSTWYLRNENSGGAGEYAFGYGGPTDRVITGDWDGNGTTTPGVVRGSHWYLRNVNSSGPGTVAFTYAP